MKTYEVGRYRGPHSSKHEADDEKAAVAMRYPGARITQLATLDEDDGGGKLFLVDGVEVVAREV